MFRRALPSSKAATTKHHPYAAIEHRVIDSPAFADLKPTSKVLLMLLARQLTKENNGHLQASFKWCQRFGIGSEHTLRGAIADLISHGLIYRTRSHGANGAWARYAVTWLPIKRREELFLAGFVHCAWRDWAPEPKKTTLQKLPERSGSICRVTPKVPAENAGSPPAKTADYELMPCRAVKIPLFRGLSAKTRRLRDHTKSPRPCGPALLMDYFESHARKRDHKPLVCAVSQGGAVGGASSLADVGVRPK